MKKEKVEAPDKAFKENLEVLLKDKEQKALLIAAFGKEIKNAGRRNNQRA